jgi:hypothetical protein
MNLHLALIDGDPLMRQLISAAIESAFPGAVIEAFAGEDSPLPDAGTDWSRFDAILIGEFAHASPAEALAFVRAFTLNTTRRPVVYLAGARADTPLSASLKLLAVRKLVRDSFAEADLIKAIVFARRDRGLMLPVNATEVFRPVTELPIAFDVTEPMPQHLLATQPLKPPPIVTIIDGLPGFRAVLATFVRLRWPQAVIEEIDPYSQTINGEHSAMSTRGAVILIGAMGSSAEARASLDRVKGRLNCPPIVAFIPRAMADEKEALLSLGATAIFFKDAFSQNALNASLAAWLPEPAKPIVPVVAGRFGEFKLILHGEAQTIDVEGYRCLDVIAANQMAHVFYAERVSDRKRAVIKVEVETPSHNAPAIRLFCERLPFFSGLEGRGVVRYLDVGMCGPWPYVALEYLAAGDLRRRMNGAMPPTDAARTMYKLAAALSSLHSGDMAHLDLKPENIFFRDNGDLVLIDFNISTKFGEIAKSARAGSGEVIGSPSYMSPEQGRGDAIDGRSDLYSAGVILFEMLVGEKPYTAKNNAEVIFRHIHDEIPLLPKAVREFQPIIDRLMAKSRYERFASGAELAFALQPFLHSNPPPAAA